MWRYTPYTEYASNVYCVNVTELQLQSFTLKQLFSEESCSVVGLSEKMSLQL